VGLVPFLDEAKSILHGQVVDSESENVPVLPGFTIKVFGIDYKRKDGGRKILDGWFHIVVKSPSRIATLFLSGERRDNGNAKYTSIGEFVPNPPIKCKNLKEGGKIRFANQRSIVPCAGANEFDPLVSKTFQSERWTIWLD